MPNGKTLLYYTGRVIAPLAILAIGIGGFMVLGQRPEPVSRTTTTQDRVLVDTAVARTFDDSFNIEVEGVAVPYRRVTFAAEVAGRITHASPEGRGGQFVDQGTPLYEIDKTNYALDVERLQAQRSQAQANVAEIDAEISSAQAMIELAREEHELQIRNLKREETQLARGAGTDSRMDEARKLEWTSRNSLQLLQNQLVSAERRKNSLQAAERLATAQLRQAETDLARTTVVAPMTGTIIEHLVEEGDYVKAGDPLFRMNDTQRMEVACNLRVDELYWIWLQAGTFAPDMVNPAADALEIPPAPATVVFDFDGNEYQWEGVLSRYEGSGVDPATRTVPCRVLVEQPRKVNVAHGRAPGPVAPPTLFSGMYVKTLIPIRPPEALLAIPMRAVRPGGEVWIVRDGKILVRKIDVVRMVAETALVKPHPDGLTDGDSVVTSPLSSVRDGLEVEIISSRSGPEATSAPAGTAAVVSPRSPA